MTFMKKVLKGSALLTSLLAICCALGACGNSQPAASSTAAATQEPETEVAETATGDYEFRFLGEAEYLDGKTYHINITGSSEDDSFELLIDELPALALTGNYVYEENKGYKLYFDDADSQYVYTQYDTESGEFSFRYNLNLGEALGTTRVPFTYSDPEFASVYDGEGLGMIPPVFTGHGYGGYAAKFDLDCKLTCFEDGTAVLTGEAVVPIETRRGTYTYDEETNVYHITLGEQPYTDARRTDDGQYQCVDGLENIIGVDNASALTEFDTVYDEATDTYSLDMQIVWFIYANIDMSYTPD